LAKIGATSRAKSGGDASAAKHVAARHAAATANKSIAARLMRIRF
jgi:hypothetical protein